MSKISEANREPWKEGHPGKAEAINTEMKLPNNHCSVPYQVRHMRKGLLPHLRVDFEEIKHNDWVQRCMLNTKHQDYGTNTLQPM